MSFHKEEQIPLKRIHFTVLFALLAVSTATYVTPERDSSFNLTSMGRVTGVRVWESYSGSIGGIQLRYGYVWSKIAGHLSGTPLKMKLYDGETFVHVSGKFSGYLHSVIFYTNQRRFLQAGRPSGTSFEMFPENSRAELVSIYGRSDSWGIISLGAHWAVFEPDAVAEGSPPQDVTGIYI